MSLSLTPQQISLLIGRKRVDIQKLRYFPSTRFTLFHSFQIRFLIAAAARMSAFSPINDNTWINTFDEEIPAAEIAVACD